MDQSSRFAEARVELSRKRADLTAKIEQLGVHDPAETSSLGFGKRIGDATSYAVERMNGAYQARTLYATVREIDQALTRLDAGAYGVCITCGQPIPQERMRAVPWAAHCMPCSASPGRTGQRR